MPSLDFSLFPGRDARAPLAVGGTNGATLRLVLALLIAPVALTMVSYVGALALGGPISANPVRTIVAALSRLLLPGLRADSWDPMLHALALAHQHGTAVYDTIFFNLHEKFQYPLTSLLWLEGLGAGIHLDQETLNRVNAVVFALNAAGCVLLVRHGFLDRDTEPRGRSDWLLAAATFALAYGFWPTLYGLYIGQIQIWIDLLFTAALILWLRGGRLSCGILIGLACTMKPQLGVLLLWGLLWRERRFAIGIAATVLLAGALSILRYGLMNNLHYLDVLAFISRHGESFHPNQSVNGLLNRLLFLGNNTEWVGDQFAPYNTAVYLATLLSSLAFVAIPLGMAVRARGERAGVLDLGLAGLCCTMASPIVWEHHYGITLPVFLLAFGVVHGERAPWERAFGERAETRRRLLVAGLWTSWLLVGANLQVFDVLSRTPLNFLQSPVFFGALLLLATLCVLSADVRPSMRGLYDEREAGFGVGPDLRLARARQG
jgi:hypothetical protein